MQCGATGFLRHRKGKGQDIPRFDKKALVAVRLMCGVLLFFVLLSLAFVWFALTISGLTRQQGVLSWTLRFGLAQNNSDGLCKPRRTINAVLPQVVCLVCLR